MSRPASVIIDLAAARANLERLRAVASTSRVMAVVKADAYGHGLQHMAHALRGADAFGVACLEEAIALRDRGIEQAIVLLEGPFDAGELPEIRRHRLEIVVHHDDQLEMLEHARKHPPIPVWLKIDTGMHRLGFAAGRAAEIWRRAQDCAAVARPVRLMTHLANAHVAADPSTAQQLRRFADATAGIDAERSIANSAAALALPATHADWIRPGLALYGVSPFAGRTGADEGLRPVMSLRSALIAVKHVEAGAAVGYGACWRCPEAMPIGIVAMGYGDGYPRRGPSGIPVLVEGVRTCTIGVSSMDMLCVDLRPVPQAGVGSPVVLWGPELPIEDVACHTHTVAYELLCSMRMRAQHMVVD